MNLKSQERSEIIYKLNFNIDRILELEDTRLKPFVRGKLITPEWNFNEASVRSVITHYQSILNQLIGIQLEGINFAETYIVKRNIIMDYIADILVILSFVIEFSGDDDESKK